MTTLPQTLNVPNHRFAVVLGSGGVRSIAALGMVEVLAREGLMPDLVVGCSAGAMFGALIAAGHDANEAVRIATTLWSAEVTRKRRWRAIPQMLWPRLGRFDADFALRDDAPVMQRLEQAFGDVRIEDLRLPLRVTTTDAGTGQRVVLREGSLVQALRASIALPFMFAPVHIDGRRLIDGFVADPLPVSAAADAHSVAGAGLRVAHAAPHRRPLAHAGAGDLGTHQQPDAGPAGRGQRLRHATAEYRAAAGEARGPVRHRRPCPIWWTPAGAPPRPCCPPSARC